MNIKILRRKKLAQVKIYGLRTSIERNRNQLSDAVHQAVIEVLGFPPEKKFQRFIGFESKDFVFPSDRTVDYTIIEISMFQGRSVETKKTLVQAIFRNIEQACGISSQDIEITEPLAKINSILIYSLKEFMV